MSFDKPSDAQQPTARPATATDPIAAINDAFNSHSVVALAEGNHGTEPAHRFRLSLIRSPQFASTVNDTFRAALGDLRSSQAIDRRDLRCRYWHGHVHHVGNGHLGNGRGTFVLSQ